MAQTDQTCLQGAANNASSGCSPQEMESDSKFEHFFGLSPVYVASDMESENDSGCWVRSPPTCENLEEFDPSQEELGSLNVQEIIRLARGRHAAPPNTSSNVDAHCDTNSPKKLSGVANTLGFDSVFDSVFPNDDDFMLAVKQWESDEVYLENSKPKLHEPETIFEPESMVFQPMWAKEVTIGDGVQQLENTVCKNTVLELPEIRKTTVPSNRQIFANERDSYANSSRAFEHQGSDRARAIKFNSHVTLSPIEESTTLRNSGNCVRKQGCSESQQEVNVQLLNKKSSTVLPLDNVLNNTLDSQDYLNSSSILNETCLPEHKTQNRTNTETSSKVESNQKVSCNRVSTTPLGDNFNRSRYNLTQLVGMVHQNSIIEEPAEGCHANSLKIESPPSLSRKIRISESLCVPESPVHCSRRLPKEEKISVAVAELLHAKENEECNLGSKFNIMLDLSDGDDDADKHETRTSFDIPATQTWNHEAPIQVNCDLGIDSLFDDSSEETVTGHHVSILKKSVHYHSPPTIPMPENVSPLPFDLPNSTQKFNGICSSTPLPSCKSQTKASVSKCLSTPDSDLRPVRRKRVRILTTPTQSTSKTTRSTEAKQLKPKVKPFRRRKKCLIDEFIDDEASESDASNVSADESESGLDKFEESFVDDETAEESSMAGIYLRAIRSPIPPNQRFKLQYQPKFVGNVLSQLPTSSMLASQYEHDSFCVSNEDEVGTDASLSPEHFPTVKRKKKVLSRIVALISSSDEDPEDEIEVPFGVPSSSGIKHNINLSEQHGRSTDLPSHSRTPAENIQSSEHIAVSEVTSASSHPVGNSGTLLVASRTLNGCQELVSTLRFRHKVNAVVTSFVGCDYIVSNRMAVERMLVSEIASTTNRARIIEQVQTMMALFERSCVILEADKSYDRPRTKYLNTVTGALLQLPIKILHSGSQEESANLLHELMVLERRKNYGINIDTHLTTDEVQLCKFYLKMPGINYVTALNLCKKFCSPQEVINSSTKVLEMKGSISSSKANAIAKFLRKKLGS